MGQSKGSGFNGLEGVKGFEANNATEEENRFFRLNPRNWLAELCNNYTPFVVTVRLRGVFHFPFT